MKLTARRLMHGEQESHFGGRRFDQDLELITRKMPTTTMTAPTPARAGPLLVPLSANLPLNPPMIMTSPMMMLMTPRIHRRLSETDRAGQIFLVLHK